MFVKPLKEHITGLLRYEKWSTKLISKRYKLDGEDCVSHETIYRWIWNVKKSKKKTDLRKVSEKRIKEVERLLNYRSIIKFNYLTQFKS